MISLQELKNPYYSHDQNEAIKAFLGALIIDKGIIQNKQKLFYDEWDTQTEDIFRVLDEKLFKKFKTIKWSHIQFDPDAGLVKEFFNNEPFVFKLPICPWPNKKDITEAFTKLFLWPLVKAKAIDDLVYIIFRNVISLLWVYWNAEEKVVWFWVKQKTDAVRLWNKWKNVKFDTFEITLEEVLEAELLQWFVNKEIWDPHRWYAYTHLLRQHAKFRLTTWAKSSIINWKRYNVLACTRWQWKTFLASLMAVRALLDPSPWFWGREFQEIRYFVPEKEDIGDQVMTYIKSFIWDIRNHKLPSGQKAFEISRFWIKCNITGNNFSIISLFNYWKRDQSLGTSKGEGIACDLAIIDEAARIPDDFWTSFHQRAAFETKSFFLISTINEETPADHWFYKLLIDWETWDPDINSQRVTIDDNEVMRHWKLESQWRKELETVKDTLRKKWEKEFYSKGYCVILDESNVFNLWGSIVSSNESKYSPNDIRILGFDLAKLTDDAGLVLINLTHREIESAIRVRNMSYWMQLIYAKEYKEKYKNLLIIGDRSWVGEAVSEMDTWGYVDAWIKSTWEWDLKYNKKLRYYTANKWYIITNLAGSFNNNLIKIPNHNNELIEQMRNFVKLKSWRWEVILYKGKGASKDDLVLSSAYAMLYITSILNLKTVQDIEDYVKESWNASTYLYNDTEDHDSWYYRGYY